MESIISSLLAQFEKGSLSRRELVQGLAMLAAGGTAAAAQDNIDFKTADIDHVSIQVADLQRSVEFYQRMFGFSVVSEDKPWALFASATPGRWSLSTAKALPQSWTTSRSECPVLPRRPLRAI